MSRPIRADRRAWRYLMTSLALAMLVIAGAQLSDGYTGDVTSGDLDSHSSFHYELTRVLALAAGFTPEEAETIALADMATDDGKFKGYSGTTIYINNTLRTEQNAPYYHFPRRGAYYPSVPVEGAQGDTCDYFATSTQPAPNAPCQQGADGYLRELDEIESWAIRGLDTLSAPDETKPTFSYSKKGPFEELKGQTLEALGIFLHSLADSYSHEKCMMEAQQRIHSDSAVSCKVKWHKKAEFGSGDGVLYTKMAGRAVWQAINDYRAAKGLAQSDWDAAAFIDTFVEKKKANARVEYANETFNSLAGQ